MVDIIWENIKDGDKAAFKALFDRYYLPLCHFTSTITENYTVAEDIVVDCFVKLWENRDDIIVRKSLKNYLVTVVKNSALDHLRKKKVVKVDIGDIYKNLPTEEEAGINEAKLYNELYTVINKLPERRREILKMAAFENKTYPEIAEELNISVNTVKTQISRAYKFIKDELDSKKAPIYLLLMF